MMTEPERMQPVLKPANQNTIQTGVLEQYKTDFNGAVCAGDEQLAELDDGLRCG